MILNISINNFFSVRDEAVLDLQPCSLRLPHRASISENVFEYSGQKFLKSIALFGPNASGKSNLLKAIEYCINLIGATPAETEKMLQQDVAYKFHKSSCSNPSKFEIEFLVGANRYLYGFHISNHELTEEYLYGFPKKYKSLFFKRSKNNEKYEYNFSKRFNRPKEVMANTSSTSLLIAVASQMNREIPMDIVKYFRESVRFGIPLIDLSSAEGLLLSYKELILATLSKADSDIIDYEYQSNPKTPQRKRLVTFHRTDPSKPFVFENEESAGTIKLLSVVLAFIEASQGRKTLLIDELETSLHSQLTEYVVKMFNQDAKSQLIFTTHDVNLLDIELLRPDQIYFTTKDYASGATELYSLADFSDYRSYANLRRDYLQGRFDAIPIL